MVTVSFTILSLFSGIMSIGAIVLTLFIVNKVYQEDYRKPWLFIGISAIFFAISELVRFSSQFLGYQIISLSITDAIILVMVFVSISFLTYGLLLEYLVLNYYKGKFVKMKFIPVQEGTLGGELDINVTKGKSYYAFKKDRKFLFEQFVQATKKGFQGFILTEDNPKEFRAKYNLPKSPIAWITQVEKNLDSNYVRDALDENSDMVDPIEINNIITYIDSFLEQSTSSFVMFELNLILKVNNFSIIAEFLQYLSGRTQKYEGVLIFLINTDNINNSNLEQLKEFLFELE